MSIVNKVPDPSENIKLFFDEDGEICGTIGDLVWKNWINGKIPMELSRHEVELEIPKGWQQIIHGKVEPVIRSSAIVTVCVLLLKIPGKANTYILRDPITKKIVRTHVQAKFDERKKKISVKIINDEKKLQKRLSKSKSSLNISIGRIKLSRILINSVYWPPSLHTISQLSKFSEKLDKEGLIDPNDFTLEKIEGNDIRAIWQPIYKIFGFITYCTKKKA